MVLSQWLFCVSGGGGGLRASDAALATHNYMLKMFVLDSFVASNRQIKPQLMDYFVTSGAYVALLVLFLFISIELCFAF